MKDRSASITDSFKRRIDASALMEAYVGSQLTRAGLHVHLHPATLAAEKGVPLSYYSHSWDLEVSADDGAMTPVEVKSSNLSFSFPNSYPHLGVLVCSLASWDKKWPNKMETQRDFLMVSRDTGGIIWLPTGATITTKPITDKTRKETYPCVVTHKSYLMPLSGFVSYIKGEPWETKP